MKLTEIVESLLKEKQLTKRWLATKVGMKVDGLRYALKNHSLKFDEIFMMAEAFDVPLHTFFPPQKKAYAESDENNLVSDSATHKKYQQEKDKEEIKKLKEINTKLKEEIALLKDQLKDKAHIIQLMSAK